MHGAVRVWFCLWKMGAIFLSDPIGCTCKTRRSKNSRPVEVSIGNLNKENVELYKIQSIETAIVIVGYVVTHYITNFFVNDSLKHTHLQRGRRKMIIKAIHLLSFLTATVLLSAIWGLKQNEIAVFVGTLLTALGIAFFAQWSLLSNLTSSLLIFFNHPVKIGDRIKILDKDCPFEGEVVDLTYFFVHVETDTGELTTIPNSLLLQKSVSVVERSTGKSGNA
jgi:small-conductance mechanosensitive channel